MIVQKGTALSKSAMHLEIKKHALIANSLANTAPPMCKLAMCNYFVKAV